jgi:hypothetical protein
LIEGTFTLTIGGLSLRVWSSITNSYSVSAIPYNIARYDLEAGFRQINGF